MTRKEILQRLHHKSSRTLFESVFSVALFFGLPVIMLGLAFPAVEPVSEPVGWAITVWGAFLYWWAGIIYAIETGRVIRIPRVADEPRSDTLEQGG